MSELVKFEIGTVYRATMESRPYGAFRCIKLADGKATFSYMENGKARKRSAAIINDYRYEKVHIYGIPFPFPIHIRACDKEGF